MKIKQRECLSKNSVNGCKVEVERRGRDGEEKRYN